MTKMKSPVLLIVFKRFDTARLVFERIREAKPPRLYVAADAPRPNVEGEVEECEKTRTIIKLVDWPCEVKTLFQTENQGCGMGPYKAISWFFENEEKGIILEDDCIAHSEFFAYMDEMLERYENDNRISLLAGRNVYGKYSPSNESYFLSALHFCWGWASWRRVWTNYNHDISSIKFWPYFRHLYHLWGWEPLLLMWRLSIFMQCKLQPTMDVWDYQFAITTQMKETYTIVPCVNLVQNVGFDERATHTIASDFEDVPSYPIYPLKHAEVLSYDKHFDKRAKCFDNKYRFFARFVKLLIKYLLKRK